uniref:Uncharacterized protein n=1 Tax=Clytia hemisphaerica TaxID=252671 RepID=A0A7M5X200_9CNID|eukprot:TCONS_00012146-protein
MKSCFLIYSEVKKHYRKISLPFTTMVSKDKKKQERSRLIDAGKQFCGRNCSYGSVVQASSQRQQNRRHDGNNNNGDVLIEDVGKKMSTHTMNGSHKDFGDLLQSRLSLMSLNRKDSRCSLPGYTSMVDMKLNSLAQLSPLKSSMISLGKLEECPENELETRSSSTSNLDRRQAKTPSLMRRLSLRKKSGMRSPAKIGTHKRSGSVPFESAFLTSKPDRKLSFRRKGSRNDEFSMASILQKALMPPGIDEATRMVFNASRRKGRRNAVCEVGAHERDGLRMYLNEKMKGKQEEVEEG